MGRVFSVVAENQTLSTGSVLVALQTAAAATTAGGLIRPLRVEVSQSGSTTSAQTRLVFSTRDTAGTLTTTSVTPANTVLGGPASGLSGSTSVIGAAARIGIISSADSGGAYTNQLAVAPNVLNGYLYIPTPEERFIIPPSTVWLVRFATAPSSLTGWA
jgi:hypothetical protein